MKTKKTKAEAVSTPTTRKPAARRSSATPAKARAAVKAKPSTAAKPIVRPAAVKTARRTTALPAAVVPAAQPATKTRRAIFIDVENTSSEAALAEVLDALAIDRRAQTVELSAVGNWRTVGQPMARRLAGLGAQLVHSAPAKGVRDWSDLWIAVAAGCWLGQAAPGDVLEIVSNDKAFEAVGDAAAARGIVYRLLHHRRGAAAATPAPEAKAIAGRSGRSGRSRGGRRRGRAPADQRAVAASRTTNPPAAAAPPRAAHPVAEPHGATREQMIDLIHRLMQGDPHRWVNLDVLEKELKQEGFSRPPNSPRLVTRLRTLKEVEVSPQGRVRLLPHRQD